jgi:hypothetical protein
MKLADLVNVVNYYEFLRIRVSGEYKSRFIGQCSDLREQKPDYLEKEVLAVFTCIDEDFGDDTPVLDIYIE